LLEVIYDIWVLVHLNFKVLFRSSWALGWKFIWSCKSRSMLKFWLLHMEFLLVSSLRSQILDSGNTSLFWKRLWRFYFSS
jgi:hypothetical protein